MEQESKEEFVKRINAYYRDLEEADRIAQAPTEEEAYGSDCRDGKCEN